MLFALPNLSSQATFQVEPWSYPVDIPPEVASDKVKFREWCLKPTTKNCHYSAVEGIDAARRVGVDNPAMLLHGIVADYDAKTSEEELKGIVERSPIELLPNWASLTFSENGRLVWLFERPIALGSRDCTKEFLKIVAKKMKLAKFLAGFDFDAFIDPSRYYDKGRNWISLSNDKIPFNYVCQWMYDAGKKANWKSEAIAIPLSIVGKAIEEKYPGRWNGPFEEGARGARFWDPSADNESAAVVRPSGMQCFTGMQGFVPWKQILGPKFVEQYEADNTGRIIADTWFDGMNYWKPGSNGEGWICKNKDDFKLELRVKYQLACTTGRGEVSSEADKVLHAVQVQKYVEGAMPLVYFPKGLVYLDRKPYLNISETEVMAPAEGAAGAWGEGFPWLAQYLDSLFDNDNQKYHFLGWLQRTYIGGYTRSPQSGQILFLSGLPGIGKTFLSTVILSKALGGHVDASTYMLGEEKFSGHVLSKPLMTVDDTIPSSDSRSRNKFSAMVKKVAANQYHLYEEKFRQARQTIWLGRVVVTCNTDAESLRILPNIELNILDKICLFRCQQPTTTFLPRADMLKLVEQELPFLLRWLLNWTLPAEYVGESRFGVKSYHHADLFAVSMQSTGTYAFYELMSGFLAAHRKEAKADAWKGTATELFSALVTFAPDATRKTTPYLVGSTLGQMRARGLKIDTTRVRGINYWTIPYNLEFSLE